MRSINLLRYNLKTSAGRCWYRLLLIWLYTSVCCVEFYLRMHFAYGKVGMPAVSWGDYLMYATGGIARLHPGIQKIEIPVKWLLLHVLILYSMADFPIYDLHHMGNVTLAKCHSRMSWLSAKLEWILLHLMVVYAGILGCTFGMAKVFGAGADTGINFRVINEIMWAESTYEEVGKGSLMEYLALGLAAAFFLAVLQLILSIWLKPIIGFAGSIIWLTVSVYIPSVWLNGNILIPLRSRWIVADGYTLASAVKALAIELPLLIGAGIMCFGKYDLLEKK